MKRIPDMSIEAKLSVFPLEGPFHTPVARPWIDIDDYETQNAFVFLKLWKIKGRFLQPVGCREGGRAGGG